MLEFLTIAVALMNLQFSIVALETLNPSFIFSNTQSVNSISSQAKLLPIPVLEPHQLVLTAKLRKVIPDIFAFVYCPKLIKELAVFNPSTMTLSLPSPMRDTVPKLETLTPVFPVPE